MVGGSAHIQASSNSQDHARMTVTVFKCGFCALLASAAIGTPFLCQCSNSAFSSFNVSRLRSKDFQLAHFKHSPGSAILTLVSP